MKFCTLFSGSSGNATYVEAGGTELLVDAGMSMRALEQALRCVGSSLHTISAICITHEHSDHIRGLGPVTRKFHTKVYANEKTARCLVGAGIAPERLCLFENGVEFTEGSLRLLPFKTPHDSADSVGYRFFGPDGCSVAVATDMGYCDEEILKPVLGADLVLLEANHDENMLVGGRYPYPLKRRILSDRGHLSNSHCAQAAETLFRSGTRRIVLGHLSAENNFPQLAYETAAEYLNRSGVQIKAGMLEVAPRSTPGELIDLSKLAPIASGE